MQSDLDIPLAAKISNSIEKSHQAWGGEGLTDCGHKQSNSKSHLSSAVAPIRRPPKQFTKTKRTSTGRSSNKIKAIFLHIFLEFGGIRVSVTTPRPFPEGRGFKPEIVRKHQLCFSYMFMCFCVQYLGHGIVHRSARYFLRIYFLGALELAPPQVKSHRKRKMHLYRNTRI